MLTLTSENETGDCFALGSAGAYTGMDKSTSDADFDFEVVIDWLWSEVS